MKGKSTGLVKQYETRGSYISSLVCSSAHWMHRAIVWVTHFERQPWLCHFPLSETIEHLLPMLLIANLVSYNNGYDNTLY